MAIKASAQITISKVIDIYACYRYYKLQSSTLAKPSKPTTNPPSGWSDTEPAYVSGSTNTLYFVDCNVYSDKSFSFSEVSKSSSYEAAKDAWNKANNAQNSVDNLEIGGRNLLRNSGKMLIGSSNYATGTWRLAGTSNSTMTKTHVDITDPPKSCQGVTGAFQAVGSHPPSKADGECISIDSFPYFDDPVGSDIIMSGWARVVGGGDNCYFGFSGYQLTLSNGKVINNYWCTKLDTTGEWTRVVIHGKTKAKVGAVYCGFITGDKSVTVQACGLKFEKGNLPTDWTPAPEDSIAKVDVEYYLSTSATALTGGSWSTTAPTWVNGKYMWSRTVTVDGAGNKTYSPNQNGVCIAGAKGDTGAKGDKGDKGATGETGPQGPQGGTGATGKGVSSIVEQYYKSTSSTALSGGSWSNTYPGWENGKYIWTRSVITYTDKTTTTTTPVCVTGTKGDTGAKGDKGETGPQGPQGVQGVKGTDGKTYYTWIKYADSPTSGMSDNPSGKKYIGVAYNKTTATESTTYSDYSWSLIKGDKGDKGDKGETGGTGPTGNGIKSITYYYARTVSQTAPSAASITATSMPTLDATNKYLWQKEVITYTNNTSQTSVLLLAVYGNTGAKGDTGTAGASLLTLITSYSYNQTEIDTYAKDGYSGTWAVSSTSGVKVNDTVLLRVTNTTKNGYCYIIAKVTKVNSATSVTATSQGVIDKGNTGAKGETGPAGKGISSTVVTYQASTSGTSIPTGTWVTSIPSVAAGSYLWTRTIITYTDKTSTTSYAVGKMGNTGATGKGIKSTSITYQAHSNGTTAPTGTWTDLVPSTSAEKPYLWSRTILTYTDNTTSTTYSVGSTPDGVLDEIKKVLRYDDTKITLGRTGSNITLNLQNDEMSISDGEKTLMNIGLTTKEADGTVWDVAYIQSDQILSLSTVNELQLSASQIISLKSFEGGITFDVQSYQGNGQPIKFYKGVNFSKGWTQYIPTLEYGNCNEITESGYYYIGSKGTNRPENTNGWLECMKYSTNYCAQTYTTITGHKYTRYMQNGTWGAWRTEPFSVNFTVGSFTTSLANRYVDISLGRTLPNTNYNVFFCTQTDIAWGSLHWLDYSVVSKSTTMVRANFWNENKVTIGNTSWSMMVVPK